MNNQDFGRFISELRKEKGLTQIELAEKINVSDKAISRWENGKNYPDIEMLEILSKELGVSISELLSCKKFENTNEAEQETTKFFVEEIKKKNKILNIIKTVIYIFLTIVVEFILTNVMIYVAFGINDFIGSGDRIIPDSLFYKSFHILLFICSLIISIILFGAILPKLSKHYHLDFKKLYLSLMFLYIILGALQIVLISFNGAGVLCYSLNALNIFTLNIYTQIESHWQVIIFALLFIICSSIKPLCYLIGNKIINNKKD